MYKLPFPPNEDSLSFDYLYHMPPGFIIFLLHSNKLGKINMNYNNNHNQIVSIKHLIPAMEHFNKQIIENKEVQIYWIITVTESELRTNLKNDETIKKN